MQRRAFVAIAAGAIALPAFLAAPAAGATQDRRLSGPYVHENLAIYLIHRKSGASVPAPLTLQEALGAGVVRVRETGDVNRLEIRNLGEREVFIQAGDIVKGGKQDRVVTVSMLIAPGSGPVFIGAFCVERGRWSKRGREDVSKFSSSTKRLPSKDGRLALITGATRSARDTLGSRQQSVSNLQGRVWKNVAEVQRKLSQNLKTGVADKRSKSSLQLSLENKQLKRATAAYVAALKKAIDGRDDVVGYVFAINGKINSADEFASAALFRKLWPKLLNASVTEAIGEKKSDARTAPKAADIVAFLDAARTAKPKHRAKVGSSRIETRESRKTVFAEAGRARGGWLHRSYFAK